MDVSEEKAIYATQGISYDQQQQHLNTGLSPRCRDGGYMIFVTLNKDELDPAHDYPDDLSADHLLWVSRRDVTVDDPDYLNLSAPDTRVSIFVRNQPREDFAYLGEAHSRDPRPIKAPKTGRSQLRFIWNLTHLVPDKLLQDLNLESRTSSGSRVLPTTPKRSRMPSSFDEMKKAYPTNASAKLSSLLDIFLPSTS